MVGEMTWLNAVPLLLTTILGVLLTVLLQQFFYTKNRKGSLAIVDDTIHFSLTSSDDNAAKRVLDNQGSGLYLNMDLECLKGPVSFTSAILELRLASKKTIKLICTAYKPRLLVNLQQGDIEPVTFIADPSPYGDHPQEILQKLVGARYKFSIASPRSPKDKIFSVGSKTIKDIALPEKIDQYGLVIPKQKELVEAERIRDILKANGIINVEIVKESDIDLTNVQFLHR